MIDLKCRKHVDLKEILDFYKLELESDNKSYINEALRRYSLVSKVVGKDYSELYLLPLVLKVLEIGSYEINHIVSEELINIIDPNTQYTENSKRTIKDICNCLLFNEEMSIRMESIKSLEVVFSRFQGKSSILSFIEEILSPIIKTKFDFSGNNYISSSSSLTDKLSLCNIIPSLMLPYCNKLEKNNLVLLYLSLCDDEVPSLRIGASQKLVQILKNIFPLKCGMSKVEYQQLKLSDQNIITEKLLNLVLALYKDQTCDILKPASIGIAIQLYTNPIFYIEFISCDDRDSLLYFICSVFENRTYLQRQAVIEELIPLCLSLKGYYELNQEDNEVIKFNGYVSNDSYNILSNIKAINYSVDIVQFLFDNLSKDVDVEIRLLTFKFIEKLLKMGIDIFESNKNQISGRTIEYQRKPAIDEVVISIIMYIYKNISELLSVGNIQFKCIFCKILVQMIIYSQQLFECESLNQKVKNLNSMEHLKIKDIFIQVFISHFSDPNINVVNTAIENLHKMINLVSEEQLSDFILPKIKSVLFVDVDLIAYNNNRVEKSIALHKWRIIRCIIRQIPLWIRYNQLCVRVCPFYNSIIVRSILDTAFSVNISALQTIMRIISKFNDFNECTTWINEFIIPSILLPYIENKTHSIKYTFDMADYINYNNIDNFNSNKNIEIYEYKFESCDYMNRIFIINLIFSIYRSLFYKWAYINFQEFKEYLNSVTLNMPNYYRANGSYIEEQNNPPIGMLSNILDREELFVKFSRLVVPIIKNSIDDPIKNVSIAASQLVVQVIKIFSLDLYLIWDKEMFACSSFGERDEFNTNNDTDELLKEHLLNQFEFDSVWHLRSIMSNNKIDQKNVYLFPNCIYQEFITVFEKVDELEVIENDIELVSPINSIKEWYSTYKNNLLSPGKRFVI